MVAIPSGILCGTVRLSILAVEHRGLAHYASRDAEDEMVKVRMRVQHANMAVTRERTIFDCVLCVKS